MAYIHTHFYNMYINYSVGHRRSGTSHIHILAVGTSRAAPPPWLMGAFGGRPRPCRRHRRSRHQKSVCRVVRRWQSARTPALTQAVTEYSHKNAHANDFVHPSVALDLHASVVFPNEHRVDVQLSHARESKTTLHHLLDGPDKPYRGCGRKTDFHL